MARILTRSGCLCQFEGVFYWYGGNPRGFREQYCYTSRDLIHWTNQGVVLRHDTDANRIDVLYNDTTKQYVMFLKYDGNGAYLGIATADKPEGPFTFQSKTLIDDARIGDMSVFKDSDGKAYLCYVSWATGVDAEHGIYRMSEDYLTPDKKMFLWDIRGREAPTSSSETASTITGPRGPRGFNRRERVITRPQIWKGRGRRPSRCRHRVRPTLGTLRWTSSIQSRGRKGQCTCTLAIAGSRTRRTDETGITSGCRWSLTATRRSSTTIRTGK